MKHLYHPVAFVLAALVCLLMSVSGCALFEETTGDQVIRFTAASSLDTKVYYGNEQNGKIQLIWETGDQIRIVSDRARTSSGSSSHDYRLRHDREEGSHSYAKFDLNDAGENGLRWEESGDYEFYATYPAVSVSSDGSFSADVSDDRYLMVAHTTAAYNTQRKVFLSFYPAFTAFEVTITADDSSVSVDDSELYSLVTPMAGKFTAKIGNAGIYDYNVTSPERSAYPASSLTSGSRSSKTFIFFCLPQDLRNVVLYCTFTKDGQTRTKSLALSSGGSSIVFSACKYHRLNLTLDSSGGDVEIEFSDMSMGGCQMLLSLLKQNAWSLQQYAQNRGVTLDQNLAVNLFNYYVNNNVGQVDARDAFKGTGSNSFTSDQLPVIKDFLGTLTNYTHQNSLWASIEATDFVFVPNLETINQLEVDPQKVNNYGMSIDVSGLQKLKSISLYKCTHLSVSDCPQLTSVQMMNIDNNYSCDFSLSNCPKVTSFSQDWNGQRCSFSFTNMSGLQTISLKNGASVTVDNCSALTSLGMEQASNLESISISNAPNFTGGEFKTVEKTVSVSVSNCSANVSGATLILRGNGNATNAGKTNSDNLTVKFIDNGGNEKTRF